MKRLLVYFTYLGTNYRGLQSIIRSDSKRPDLDSVQGILEFGIRKVLQNNDLSLAVSSRTDAGVHALESTAHFDAPDECFAKFPYSPEKICQHINLFLAKNECDIRIKRIVQVEKDFACRRASSRIYEFRIAVLNQHPHNVSSILRLTPSVSIKDLNSCEVVSQPFDVQSVQDACKVFVGKWDFTSFMKSSSKELVPPEKRVKTIFRFSCSPEIIPETHWSSSLPLLPDPYQIYTFTVEGSGFLHRQVRRMVGALVGVGHGVIGPTDIKRMLENPSEQNWSPKIPVLGPNGLFLKRVNYSYLHWGILRGYLS